ncbi:MAG: PilZ domain-containing protein [Phycisphaerales bacterium]|nr:PilZ domain-containing protein [Phycisphaerales bacterium]
MVRPCKLFHRPTGRYLAASTCDLSAGGAMLRVRAPRPLRPGDEVEVLIALHPRQLLEASNQRSARVVRVMGTPGGDQIAGVEYAAAAQSRLAA